MKLIVTGGAGFIGSNFVRYWLRRHPGDHLVNVDKLTYAGSLLNLEDVSEGHQFVQMDICDPAVDELLTGADAVVHFAAESHVDRSIDSSEIFVRTNVLGTQRLLDAARRHKVPLFLQVSTDEVYGALGADGEFNEETPLRPSSPYSATKAAADLLAQSYFYTHGLPVVITRCSNNYGPYQHPEKFIPLMATNALRGLPLPVYGQGAQVREWLHVEDHCSALECVLQRGRPGEVYNLGSGHRLTNLQVAEAILKSLNRPRSLLQFVADRPGHDFRYAVDCTKARRELDWQPRYDWEAGLRQTLDWYERNRSWVTSVRGDGYNSYYSRMYDKREEFLRNL